MNLERVNRWRNVARNAEQREGGWVSGGLRDDMFIMAPTPYGGYLMMGGFVNPPQKPLPRSQYTYIPAPNYMFMQ